MNIISPKLILTTLTFSFLISTSCQLWGGEGDENDSTEETTRGLKTKSVAPPEGESKLKKSRTETPPKSLEKNKEQPRNHAAVEELTHQEEEESEKTQTGSKIEVNLNKLDGKQKERLARIQTESLCYGTLDSSSLEIVAYSSMLEKSKKEIKSAVNKNVHSSTLRNWKRFLFNNKILTEKEAGIQSKNKEDQNDSNMPKPLTDDQQKRLKEIEDEKLCYGKLDWSGLKKFAELVMEGKSNQGIMHDLEAGRSDVTNWKKFLHKKRILTDKEANKKTTNYKRTQDDSHVSLTAKQQERLQEIVDKNLSFGQRNCIFLRNFAYLVMIHKSGNEIQSELKLDVSSAYLTRLKRFLYKNELLTEEETGIGSRPNRKKRKTPEDVGKSKKSRTETQPSVQEEGMKLNDDHSPRISNDAMSDSYTVSNRFGTPERLYPLSSQGEDLQPPFLSTMSDPVLESLRSTFMSYRPPTRGR